jgi:hypothetical protein
MYTVLPLVALLASLTIPSCANPASEACPAYRYRRTEAL